MSVTIDLDIMLFEAGIIANGVSNNQAGQALSGRLLQETNAAEEAGKAALTFTFSAFEAGLAYGAVLAMVGSEADDLASRLLTNVRQVMQQLGAIPQGDLGDEQGEGDAAQVTADAQDNGVASTGSPSVTDSEANSSSSAAETDTAAS